MYRTGFLAGHGRFILITAIILLVLGAIIPKMEMKTPERQIFLLNGYLTKHNAQPQAGHFFESIKRNNGYLCLGTSESTTVPGGNYYDYLNSDADFASTKLSLMSGAGRTAGKHLSLLSNNREAVKGLKIIYIINPVYWREDLAKVNKAYWSRYCNYPDAQNTLDELGTEKATSIERYIDKLSWPEKVIAALTHHLRVLRSKYFSDLYFRFQPDEYHKQFSFIPEKPKAVIDYSDSTNHKFDWLNEEYNVEKSFTEFGWYKPIASDLAYRNNELKDMISTCSDLNIEVVFVLGPYNAQFIAKQGASDLEGYQKTVDDLEKLLQSLGANYVDATDISTVRGAFKDHQHHSSYGAYLIYKKLKTYLNEK